MKKGNIITIDNQIEIFKRDYKPEDYKVFNYLFLRNQLKFKSVREENIAIQQELLSLYEGDKPEEFLLSKQEFIDFLNEEVEIEFYTMKIDKLEGEFNLKIAEYLVTSGILVE